MEIYEKFENNTELKEYVDVKEGLARVVNHVVVYKKVLNSFLVSTYFEDFRAQVESGNSDALMAIHTLKGVSANLSLPKLNALCISTEAKMKDGDKVDGDLDGLAAVVQKTKEYVTTVVNSL